MAKSGRHPEKKLQQSAFGIYAKPDGTQMAAASTSWSIQAARSDGFNASSVQGRRRDIGLGGAATVSLAKRARRLWRSANRLGAAGDPIAERRAAQRHVPTFVEAIDAVHAEHKKSWKNEKHGDQWINTLRTYAVPIIATCASTASKQPMSYEFWAPVWTEKPETARRIRQRLSTVLSKWAKANGFRSGENPVEGAELGLAKQTKVQIEFCCAPHPKIPVFMTDLEKTKTGTIPKLAFTS